MVGWARRTVLALIIAGLSATAHASADVPPDTETVSFDSRDAVFLDDLLVGGSKASSRTITGLFGLPARDTAAKVPAAIILHTSSGPSALEWGMASTLNAAGIASLVVDSFGPRGVRRSGDDQTRVTEASMIADAYSARDFLAKDPRIRADRIAVIGFSKGAVVALYSAMTEITEPLTGASGTRFAAHLAFYPWCGLNLFTRRTTGAPILIQMGESDTMVSPGQCSTLVDSIRQADANARIDLALYPGAYHAFNHPILAYMATTVMTGAQNPGACRIVETAPGIFRETSTDRPIHHGNYRDVLKACLGRGGLVGYDSAAAIVANERSLAFLHKTLFAP